MGACARPDEGAPSERNASRPTFWPRRRTSRRLANRAGGTIGGEKAMRATLEWLSSAGHSDQRRDRPGTARETERANHRGQFGNPLECYSPINGCPDHVRARRSVGDGQESVVLGNGISPTQTSPPDLIRGSTHPASLLAFFTSPTRGLEVVWRCQMEGAGGAFQTHRGLERYARMAGGRCSGGAARLYSADRQKSIG